ncbi:MAG: DUF167 family protein [Anaerolineae bacterium]|nr:DUF167 family protein [Anaerolineae bacterium]
MPRDFEITDAQHGAAFGVRIVTPADEVAIAGIHPDGSLEIRLTEPLAEGRANAQLVAVLAEALEVPPARVAIVAGDGLNKIVSVEGVSATWIDGWLAGWR